MRCKTLLFFLILSGLPLHRSFAWTLEVETPPFAELRAPGAQIKGKPAHGRHSLSLPDSLHETKLEVRGPLGGFVARSVSKEDAGKTFRFETGIIAGDDPNPALLPNLPSLCPRLEAQASKAGFPPTYLYRGEIDPLNRFPITQLSDPDKAEGRQAESVRLIDGRNALLLKSVRLSYDYEDDAIIDERRIDPSGEPVEIREGRGGFYANLHYAVIPYAPEVLELPEQSLLHLAQGSLSHIGQEALRPALRTHGFLPGPFLSRSSFGYAFCEWGDTAKQAPEQKLDYRGIAMWDWDYSVTPTERILLIVWEGDEEEEARAQGLIGPNRLTDDLIGVFEVSRRASLTPLTLKNSRGDFEMTVQTGDFLVRPSPPAPSLPLAKNPS